MRSTNYFHLSLVLLMAILFVSGCRINSSDPVSFESDKNKLMVIIPENVNADLYRISLFSDTTKDTLIYYETSSSHVLGVTVSPEATTQITILGFKENDIIYSAKAVILPQQKSTISPEAFELLKLSPPSTLSAKATDEKKVLLGWSPVNDGESYIIYRTTDTLASPLELTVVKSDSWIDNEVVPEIEYFYQIKAKKGLIVSKPSSFVAIKVHSNGIDSNNTVPAVPSGLKIIVSGGNVELSWNESSNAASYIIYRADSVDEPVHEIATTDKPFFIDSISQRLTRPGYCIASVNSTGTSIKTDIQWIDLTSPPIPIPAIPSNLKGTGLSENSLQIVWNKTKNAISYIIEWSTSESGSFSSRETDTTTIILESLSASTTYYVKVSAKNVTGQSAWSDFIQVTTLNPALKPPGSPELSAKVVSDTSISITWGAVPDASSYIIEKAQTTPGTFSPACTTSDLSFTDTRCISNTTYYYRGKAKNSAGISLSYSSTVSAKTYLTLFPPTELTTDTITGTSIIITWKAANGAESYKIYNSLSENGTYSLSGTSESTRYTISSLTTGTKYYFSVSSVSGTQESKRSDIISAVTKSTGPEIPSGLKISTQTSSSITITFNVVNGAKEYVIYSGSQSISLSPVDTITSNTFTHSNLAAATTYYFAVASKNESDISAKSTSVSGTTSANTPAIPTGLTATASSSTSISIKFNSISGATGYKLYSGKSSSNLTLLATITETSYTHNNLTANTTYYYKVSSINGTIESAQSSVVSTTTKSASKVAVIGSSCNSCGRCVSACNQRAISRGSTKYVIDPAKCNGCGDCISSCPRQAITLQ